MCLAPWSGLPLSLVFLRLNLLRGAPLEASFQVQRAIPNLPQRPALDHLMAAANTNNFELRTRAAELVQQGFRVDLARNERWPAFEVGPMTMGQDGSTLDRIVGVGVAFPLPLWRPRTANIAATEAKRLDGEIRKVEAEIEKVAKKLSSETFVQNAPAEVVADHRQRQQDWIAKLAELQKARASLG